MLGLISLPFLLFVVYRELRFLLQRLTFVLLLHREQMINHVQFPPVVCMYMQCLILIDIDVQSRAGLCRCYIYQSAFIQNAPAMPCNLYIHRNPPSYIHQSINHVRIHNHYLVGQGIFSPISPQKRSGIRQEYQASYPFLFLPNSIPPPIISFSIYSSAGLCQSSTKLLELPLPLPLELLTTLPLATDTKR